MSARQKNRRRAPWGRGQGGEHKPLLINGAVTDLVDNLLGHIISNLTWSFALMQWSRKQVSIFTFFSSEKIQHDHEDSLELHLYSNQMHLCLMWQLLCSSLPEWWNTAAQPFISYSHFSLNYSSVRLKSATRFNYIVVKQKPFFICFLSFHTNAIFLNSEDENHPALSMLFCNTMLIDLWEQQEADTHFRCSLYEETNHSCTVFPWLLHQNLVCSEMHAGTYVLLLQFN